MTSYLDNIDKTLWRSYRFDKLALQKKNLIDRNNSELTKYIKGEHMGSEDIHIRKWGDLADEYLGPAFRTRFEPGDILYGSRRTYLRKVAVAHFEGITSNTTFVLSPNTDYINPELLPYLMLSENFSQYSISKSKGSVNPYINWKDIASYETKIPPENFQLQLIEIFSGVDDSIEKNMKLLESATNYYSSLASKLIRSKSDDNAIPLSDLLTLNYGKGLTESERIDGPYDVVSSSGISGKHRVKLVDGPGIVVGRKGNVGNVSWVDRDFWPIDTAYWVSINDKYKNVPLRYIFHLLAALPFKKYSIATAVPGLSRDDAYSIQINEPDLKVVNSLTDQLDNALRYIDLVEQKIKAAKELRKSIIDRVF